MPCIEIVSHIVTLSIVIVMPKIVPKNPSYIYYIILYKPICIGAYLSCSNCLIVTRFKFVLHTDFSCFLYVLLLPVLLLLLLQLLSGSLTAWNVIRKSPFLWMYFESAWIINPDMETYMNRYIYKNELTNSTILYIFSCSAQNHIQFTLLQIRKYFSLVTLKCP